MAERYALVVSLWIYPGKEAEFEAFEAEAARIMARHGGRIDGAVRMEAGQGDHPFEVHLVSFPDRFAHQSYLSDPEAFARKPLRAGIIARTEAAIGRSAGPYLKA
jgi:antibiotic biosynthesis monooxygenase (ABM) superfamily enzyme